MGVGGYVGTTRELEQPQPDKERAGQQGSDSTRERVWTTHSPK